jgi:hypothetical protein
MALQRLTGQNLALWRFRFGGGPGLGEECLDGGGPTLNGRGALAHPRASPMKAEVSFSR